MEIRLLDLFVHRVALQVRIVFLLLDALRNRFLVTIGEITGGRLALFLGFGALQGDEFLHGGKWIEGSEQTPAPARRNPKVDRAPLLRLHRRFSINGSITPRRKSVTWPVLDDTTIEIHFVATLTAAAAA